MFLVGMDFVGVEIVVFRIFGWGVVLCLLGFGYGGL